MSISYNRLWKLLIDKEISKGDLMSKCGIAGGVMQNLRNNTPVHLKVIERICLELDCNIEDIIEIKKDVN